MNVRRLMPAVAILAAAGLRDAAVSARRRRTPAASTGRIFDETTRPSGANVTARNVGHRPSRQLVASASGTYRIAALPAGRTT